jgi:hypothetical protein
MKSIVAASLILAAPAAAAPDVPSPVRFAPLDQKAITSPCGGNLTVDQFAKLPRAEAAGRLACFTREIVSQLNAQLPVKVDEVTTLERVAAENATVIYHLRTSLPRTAWTAAALVEVKASVRTNLCGDSRTRNMIDIGGAYRVYWSDREGEPIADLFISSC